MRAFSTRADADALADRLSGKGYQAFVTVNPANVREKFRVRVGKYATRSEADAVSAGFGRKSASTLAYPLALVAGVLLALSFPKYGHPAVAWIALVPLLVALSGGPV